MYVSTLIFISFIAGIYAEVVDLQFCSGTSRMVDHAVSELHFYRFSDGVKNSGVKNSTLVQCTCRVNLNNLLDTLIMQSTTRNTGMSCYDWVTVVHGDANETYGCENTSVKVPLEDKNGFQLILSENLSLQDDEKATSTLPLRVQLYPQQPSLTVSCSPGTMLLPTSVTQSTSASAVSTEASVKPSTAAGSPDSEANYTPLVVGLVGAGVIAGACVVCVVVCRSRRQAKDNKERFHQTVYRKASTMYKAIITRRPLPNLPTSGPTFRKGKTLEMKESGLYDSIRSQRVRHAHVIKPEVTPQSSAGSSVFYIHPVDVSNNNSQSPEHEQSRDADNDTYLTKVVMSQNNEQGQNDAAKVEEPVDEYVKQDKKVLKDCASYVNVTKENCYIDMPLKTSLNEKDALYMSMKRKSSPQLSYMTMSKSSECLVDNDQIALENENQVKSDEQANYVIESTEHNADSPDDTFPPLLKFEPLNTEKSEAELEVKAEIQTKPKRYVRDVVHQINADSISSA